ncbi:MAG: hypothetical protein C4522_01330 [Desulfobacteraceae bacterium]|nr:MAG: hypothetical protein C4522_01330 [Desulfobacteraceae bacterium]
MIIRIVHDPAERLLSDSGNAWFGIGGKPVTVSCFLICSQSRHSDPSGSPDKLAIIMPLDNPAAASRTGGKYRMKIRRTGIPFRLPETHHVHAVLPFRIRVRFAFPAVGYRSGCFFVLHKKREGFSS